MNFEILETEPGIWVCQSRLSHMIMVRYGSNSKVWEVGVLLYDHVAYLT